jgi:uncharacterized protein with GYD domain
MAHYLIEASYTTQSWSAQVDSPASPVDRITPPLEACGGTLQYLYYAFGDIDVVGVADFPTPEAAAAFSLAIGSSGATRICRLTPLLTVDQGIDALRRAGEVRKSYTPPLTVSLVEQPAPAR